MKGAKTHISNRNNFENMPTMSLVGRSSVASLMWHRSVTNWTLFERFREEINGVMEKVLLWEKKLL